MWTKEEIKRIYTLWDSKTINEIMKEMDLRRDQLNYMVCHMRKAGFVMHGKHKKGYVQNLIKECKLDLGL
jgi:hypothetical protein